jgi:maleamate amidohydrolase
MNSAPRSAAREESSLTSAALLIVDLVHLFSRGGLRMLPQIAEASDRLGEVLQPWRAAGLPIIFTRGGRNHYINPAGGAPAALRSLWSRKHGEIRADRHVAQQAAMIDPALAVRGDELVLTKPCPSAFFATPLEIMLRQLGVQTLFVGGIFTSGCVRATVTDAFSHGFDTRLIVDGCADRDRTKHERNIEEMVEKYATAVSSRELRQAAEYRRSTS